jgi:hypothetical protein
MEGSGHYRSSETNNRWRENTELSGVGGEQKTLWRRHRFFRSAGNKRSKQSYSGATENQHEISTPLMTASRNFHPTASAVDCCDLRVATRALASP